MSDTMRADELRRSQARKIHALKRENRALSRALATEKTTVREAANLVAMAEMTLHWPSLREFLERYFPHHYTKVVRP